MVNVCIAHAHSTAISYCASPLRGLHNSLSFFLISWYKGSILSENSAVACDGVYYDVDENWHENGEQIDYQDYYYDENPMKQIWFDWHYYVYHFDVMVT